MDVHTYYQKGRYNTTPQEQAELAVFYQKRVALILQALHGHPFSSLLDAGCGDGEIARILKKQTGAQIYGIDISKKGVALAKKSGIKAKVADMSVKIPYPTSSFDVVVSSATIEHVPNPDNFLKEIYRVLKPGGVLVVSTPNLAYWFNRIILLFGFYPLFLEASKEVKVGYGKFKKYFYGQQLVGHIHVFTLPALLELLSFHKFMPQNVLGRPINFVSPSSKLITFVYHLIDTIMARLPSLAADIIVVAKKKESMKA